MSEILPPELAARFAEPVELGRGAFGRVVRARDRRLDRPVAIKLLTTWRIGDDAAAARFKREAELAARLASPRFPRVYDHGLVGGLPFIVFEYLPGRALGRLLAETPGAWEPDRVRPLLSALFEALAELHRAGITHRDVKPDNLLVLEDGRLVLIDLGLGQHPDSTLLTETGHLVGTPAYLPPEIWKGAPWGPGADVYAAGLVGLQLLAGRVPMVGRDLVETLDLRLAGPRAWLAREAPRLAAGFLEALVRGLDPDPDRRPGAAAMVAELAGRPAAREDLPGPARPAGDGPGPGRPPGRVPGLVLGGLALGALALWHGGPEQGAPGHPGRTEAPAEAALAGLEAAARELAAEPAVVAAMGLTGPGPTDASRATWMRARRRFVDRGGELELATLVGRAAAGPVGPGLLAALGALARVEILLARSREAGVPALFEAGEDTGVLAALGTLVRTVPEPGLMEIMARRARLRGPAMAAWLGRGGRSFRLAFDGTGRDDPGRPEPGDPNRVRVVSGTGVPHEYLDLDADRISVGSLTKSGPDRLEATQTSIPLVLAPPAGDLVLAFESQGIGADRPGWLELAGTGRRIGFPLDPPPAPPGAEHNGWLARIDARALPPGLTGGTFTVLGLQPLGGPNPTVGLWRIWVQEGGPLPDELAGR